MNANEPLLDGLTTPEMDADSDDAFRELVDMLHDVVWAAEIFSAGFTFRKSMNQDYRACIPTADRIVTTAKALQKRIVAPESAAWHQEGEQRRQVLYGNRVSSRDYAS